MDAQNFKLKALRKKSRMPQTSPRKLDGYMETLIKFYHRKGYGADMIKEFLRGDSLKAPGTATINHVLNNRLPPVKKRRYRLKKHRRRYELAIPGQRLQLDVKYSPMLVGGKTVA